MNPARQATPLQTWTLELNSNPTERVNGPCIGIGESLDPKQVLSFATQLDLHHICQKQGFAYEKELASAQLLTQSPESFRISPIASILTPTDLSLNSERALISSEETFSGSRQKRPLLDGLTKAMESKGLSQTTIDDVVLVADEMFTNAVYNAPFVDIKTQLNPGVSRHTADVKYNADKLGRMFMAHDESRLLIGVQDPFGSLNLERWLTKIKDTYQRGPAATMNLGAGGAGLGSYIIFNAGSSLYFGVWPGQVSLICCVLPLGIPNRKRVELPKHLHWIQR